MVINDTGYDHNIFDNQILTQKSIGDNPKDSKITKYNPNDILEKDIDPENDEVVSLDDIFEEIRNKYRSRLPKSHLISNVIGKFNEHVVIRRQSRLNDTNRVCYTS